jgi:protein SCO1
MRRPRLLLPAALGVLVLAALAFAIVASKNDSKTTTSPVVSVPSENPGATVPSQGGFDGAALPGGKQAPGFSLRDQYGRQISLSALHGAPLALTFLYSTCGGPCVLIAQQIRGALDQLGRPAAVVIVSADPSADTAARVRRFLAAVSLSGRVFYLTGSAAELDPVWRAYHVTPAAAGRSAFAHFATVRLIDARGRERVLYGPEQLTPEALAHDLGKLQAG